LGRAVKATPEKTPVKAPAEEKAGDVAMETAADGAEAKAEGTGDAERKGVKRKRPDEEPFVVVEVFLIIKLVY
jgi:hypothetical protein